MFHLEGIVGFAGRVLLVLLFGFSGLRMIGDIAGMQGFMQSHSVPGVLIYPTIALNLGASLAIILGWQTRVAALTFTAFTITTAVIFHNGFLDRSQMIEFLSNISIAGGFLILAVYGPGPLSLEARKASMQPV